MHCDSGTERGKPGFDGAMLPYAGFRARRPAFDAALRGRPSLPGSQPQRTSPNLAFGPRRQRRKELVQRALNARGNARGMHQKYFAVRRARPELFFSAVEAVERPAAGALRHRACLDVPAWQILLEVRGRRTGSSGARCLSEVLFYCHGVEDDWRGSSWAWAERMAVEATGVWHAPVASTVMRSAQAIGNS